MTRRQLHRLLQVEDRRLANLERRWANEIRKALKKQGESYIRDGVIDNSMYDTLAKLTPPLMLDYMQRQLKWLEKDTKAQKKDRFFMRWSAVIAERLTTTLFNKVVEIDRTTIEDIQNSVTQYITAGETVSEIRDAIIKVTAGRYSKNRARMIARTEMGDAVAIAKKESADTWFDETGLPQGKLWIHRGAKNPRNWHMALDTGIAIPKETAFVVTNPNTGETDMMMHPHDSNASAGNVINCSCTIIYTLLD